MLEFVPRYGDLGDFGVNVDITQGDYQGRSLPFITSFMFSFMFHSGP
jgi:hypothetical protein